MFFLCKDVTVYNYEYHYNCESTQKKASDIKEKKHKAPRISVASVLYAFILDQLEQQQGAPIHTFATNQKEKRVTLNYTVCNH